MQTVSPQFLAHAKGDVRPHSFGCRISFDKAWDDDISMFTLNQSMLNSGDLLGTGEDNALQAWDFYDYKDYTDRFTYMEWGRSLEFPYSVATARADFGLANTDGYFDPGVIRKLLARNQSTNPSFENWSGTPDVVARENLVPNPAPVGLGSWGVKVPAWLSLTDSGGEIKATVGAPMGTRNAVRIRFPEATSVGKYLAGAIQVRGAGATVGQKVTACVYDNKAEASLTGTQIEATLTAEYQTINMPSVSIRTGSGDISIYVYVSTANGWGQGMEFFARRAIISPVPTEGLAVGKYFDGSYSEDVDFRVPSWTGTPNNSVSQLKIAGTSEVRRNLNPNPRMVGDTGGVADNYILYSNPDATATASKPSANIQRLHQTAATASGAISQLSRGDIGVSASTTYTAQVKVTGLSLNGSSARLMWEEYNGTTWTKQSSVTNITGEGVFSVTSTTSATTNALRLRVRIISTGTSPNSYIDFTNICLEKISILLPYFDGSTNTWQSPDLAPKWTGTPDNSASVLVGVEPTGFFSGIDTAAFLSTDSPNHGEKFVRVLRTGTNNSSMSPLDTQGVNAGDNITGSLFARPSRPMSMQVRWLKPNGAWSADASVTTVPAEWTELRHTHTAINNNNVSLGVRYNPSVTPAQAGDIVDIDNHFVVKGEYGGEYFDGDTPSAGRDTYVWDGTPNASTSSEIRVPGYILPKRPVRLLSGFKNTLIPQFVGLTQGLPESSEREKIAEFTALDFLTQIYDMPIRKTIAMANVRTDEVLANIFQQFGLSSAQYSLEKGRNVIPFLFFEKDQTLAGDVIRPLMEAEMGMLWLSEDGIIKFKSRLQISTDPVYELNGSEIVDLSVASDDEIINTVNFTGEVRVLADWQSVFTKTETETAHVVRANSTFVFEAGLKDPCLSIQQPVRGELEGVSWFVPRNSGGAIVSNVVVQSVELRTNSYDITFKNNNSFDVNISEMELYGQPGKVAYSVDYPMSYQPSVEKFETKEININNNFIQTEDQMQSLGLMILNDYAEYASIINCEIKGNPALQLGDIISIDYKQYTGNYRIINMTNSLRDDKFTQIVKLRQVEHVDWFILNSSTLNGTDILAP